MRKTKSPKLGQEKKLAVLNDALKCLNPPPKKNEPPGSFSRNTEKHTYIILCQIHRKTETPSLPPYSFPPSPFLLGIRIFYYPPDLKIFRGYSRFPDFKGLRIFFTVETRNSEITTCTERGLGDSGEKGETR